jgi:dienelactone hydrolase
MNCGKIQVSFVVRIVALACICLGAAESRAEQPADRNGAVLIADAKFVPGKLTKIQDPATGGYAYWVVWVPLDYTPERKWPVIFCYHYLGGVPSASPFKDLTDGKAYIVVGMEYLDRYARIPEVDKNLANLKRTHSLLVKRLEMDEKLFFIGGVSQGGFRTADYAEASLDTWAGMILLDAGRGVDAEKNNRLGRFAGKPIYIGDGEKDLNLPGCKQSAAYYKQRGANVTLDVYPGLGHAVDMKSATLRQWLQDRVPARIVADKRPEPATRPARLAADRRPEPGTRPATAGRVINLLPLIHPESDALSGRWKIEPSGLIADGIATDQTGARLRIPCEVPEEYDFHVVFTGVRSLTRPSVAQLLTHQGHEFGWFVRFKTGSHNGFGWINGKPVDGSPGSVLISDGDDGMGRQHDSLVQVRRHYIAGYLDGKLIERHDTDYSDLSAGSLVSVGTHAIGLRTMDYAATFSVVELVEVSGTQ